MSKWDNAVQKNLLKPFDTQIKWKPQVTTKGKNKEPILRNGQRVAGCTAHIDARDVMNRLDEVVGAENWSDAYAIIGSRNVECRLTVLEVTKCDIGEINEGGFADPFKSAYSDALKRAAVKFGIGRHLYGMEMEWLLFDGYKIIEQPGPTPEPRPTSPAPPTLGVPEEVKVSDKKPDPVAKANAELLGHDGTAEAQANTGKAKDRRAETSPQEQAEREEFRPTGEPANGNGQKVMGAVKFKEWLVLEHKFENIYHVEETMKNLDFWPTPSKPDERMRCSSALALYRDLRDNKGMSKEEVIAEVKEAENV